MYGKGGMVCTKMYDCVFQGESVKKFDFFMYVIDVWLITKKDLLINLQNL